MLLHIDDSKTVEELQDHFNKCFPYLKIEFYKETGKLNACDKTDLIAPYAFIGDIRKTSYAGTMDIKSWDKTFKVKQEFKSLYGLNVQIFRMHEGKWMPTTYSDDLTLKQQYELSKQIHSF